MSTFIKGDSEILFIYDTTAVAYVPVACLTSNGLAETVNVIESVTKCNPGETIKQAGTSSNEISFEGEYSETEAGKLSWGELKTLLRAKVALNWKIVTTFSNASTLKEFGVAILTDLEKTAPAGDEFMTFSGTLQVSGEILLTDPIV